jgi:hypothetical protein
LIAAQHGLTVSGQRLLLRQRACGQAYTTCVDGHIEWVVGARADSERFEVRRLSVDLFGYLQGRCLSRCPLNISSPPGHGMRDSARGDPHPKIIAIGRRRRKFCRRVRRLFVSNISTLHVRLPKQSRLFLIACHTRRTSPTMLCAVLCTTELSVVRGAGGPEIDRKTNEASWPGCGDWVLGAGPMQPSASELFFRPGSITPTSFRHQPSARSRRHISTGTRQLDAVFLQTPATSTTLRVPKRCVLTASDSFTRAVYLHSARHMPKGTGSTFYIPLPIALELA